MKTFAAALLVASASAFAPATTVTRSSSSSLNMVDLANGAMSFDRVCREWRCKYEGDKATSESLEAIAKVVDEYLPEIKKVSKGVTVNRLVCGACLDFSEFLLLLSHVLLLVLSEGWINKPAFNPFVLNIHRAHDYRPIGRFRSLGRKWVPTGKRVS